MFSNLPYAGSMLVIADTFISKQRAAAAATAAGILNIASLDFATGAARLTDRPAPELILVEVAKVPAKMSAFESILLRVDTADGRYVSIVSTPSALIDLVAARTSRVHQLADASVADLTDAVIVARQPPAAAFRETGALPWLASPNPPASGPAAEAAELSAQIRSALRARRLRARYFDPALFADPAWDMLLDLMAARLDGRRIAVSSLCIAAGVPPTTALRWIRTLTDRGLFVRHADPTDGRRVFIDLSDAAAASLGAYLAEVRT